MFENSENENVFKAFDYQLIVEARVKETNTADFAKFEI